MQLKIRENIVFFLIIFFGLMLRLIFLNEKALGVDEAVTMSVIQQPLNHILSTLALDYRSPFYYIISHIIFSFFNNFYVVKLLSVMFGVGIVALTYYLSKELFDKNVATMSSIFVTLHPLLLAYSQHMREYILVTFLFLAILFSMVLAIKTKKMHYSILLGIGNILLLYTSYIAVPIILSELAFFIFLFIFKKINIRLLSQYFIVAFFAGLVFLPWFFILLSESGRYAATVTITKNILDVFYVFYKFTNSITIHFLQQNAYYLLLLFPFLIILFLCSFIKLFKEDKYNILNFSFVINLFFILLFALVFPVLLNYRYILFLLPVFLVIIAVGLSQIKNPYLKKLIFILIILAFLILDLFYYGFVVIPDWNAYMGL